MRHIQRNVEECEILPRRFPGGNEETHNVRFLQSE